MRVRISSLASGFVAAAAATVPAQSSGFGTFFATMNPNGTVVSSSGVASSVKTAVGRYEITFNPDIRRCAALVNVNGAAPGYGVTRRKDGTARVLQVGTFNRSGVSTDLPTTVFIMCNS
jgi:hypothetical protein